MSNDRERLIKDGEIDLVLLFQGLLRQKLLIAVTVVVVSLGAITYALMAKPVYEARVFLQPPSQNDVARLNYGRGEHSGLPELTVKDIYDVYVRHLQSESLRREFFRKVFLPSLVQEKRGGSQDRLYGRFNSILQVDLKDKGGATSYVVAVKLPDPEKAAMWAALYAEMAGEAAKKEILTNVKSDAAVRAGSLQQQIVSAQNTALRQREDHIARLKEALLVARSIDLAKPPVILGDALSEVSGSMDGSLTYMRGSKALTAEIENLQKRSSDDPFISNLREKQAALAFYSGLEVDPKMVSVYRQDGGAELPDQPVSLSGLFVVLLGVIAGLVLGVAVALIRLLLASPHKSV
ncbi:LPS O-antigen chain length determinant protein WzzB [Pseudomonas sp.]|uniref:LPS O-antigen chain length determinant protein WzzB n=1 Tax=Pseudomonas sp. TaxID=306 RepID=UPI003D6FA68C